MSPVSFPAGGRCSCCPTPTPPLAGVEADNTLLHLKVPPQQWILGSENTAWLGGPSFRSINEEESSIGVRVIPPQPRRTGVTSVTARYCPALPPPRSLTHIKQT